MSWDEYTYGKQFGGIFRPYSDFLAEIEVSLDNLVAADPAFARFAVALSVRDMVLVTGKRVAFLSVSRGIYRQYPTRKQFEWGDFLTAPEDSFIAQHPACLTGAVRIIEQSLDEHLREKWCFTDAITIGFPSIFIAKSGTEEEVIRCRAVEGISGQLSQEEWRRFQLKTEADKPKDIFLSHKSVDKSLVRTISKTLAEIGYSPWLDEDRMKAGVPLERALLGAFADSCAAVFFITPEFQDDGYLRSEIDYALHQKREKKERFAIIALQLRGMDGAMGSIPEVLRHLFWKQVEPVEIIKAIVEALPIRMCGIEWRGRS